MLLYRRNDVQLFGFTPRGHLQARTHAFGVTLRVRVRDRWRHVQARIYWPRSDLRLGRGCYSCEVSSWLTGPGTQAPRRSRKVFVRFKVGLGGSRDDAKATDRQ